jgi:hypothetical protein
MKSPGFNKEVYFALLYTDSTPAELNCFDFDCFAVWVQYACHCDAACANGHFTPAAIVHYQRSIGRSSCKQVSPAMGAK